MAYTWNLPGYPSYLSYEQTKANNTRREYEYLKQKIQDYQQRLREINQRYRFEKEDFQSIAQINSQRDFLIQHVANVAEKDDRRKENTKIYRAILDGIMYYDSHRPTYTASSYPHYPAYTQKPYPSTWHIPGVPFPDLPKITSKTTKEKNDNATTVPQGDAGTDSPEEGESS